MTVKPSQPAMQVPLLDLKPQYQPLAAEIQAAIGRVCASQHFILGEEVRALESGIAAYSHCRYGVGVSSGTDALLLALMALGIGAGDAVITSPFTFFATAGTIARTGARPLFCDIDPQTFNLSPGAVEEFIATQCESRNGALIHRASGARVRALMPVHLYGQVADMGPLMRLARRHGLKIIEDAAQAIGARIGERRAGTIGRVGCFSFFPSKNLGGYGDGGAVTTNDEALAARMRVLRTHGGKAKYLHEIIGGNFRLDELQAAVLRVKLPHLDDWVAARRAHAAGYRAGLRGVGLPEEKHFHVYNQFVVRSPRRDALQQHLKAAGVDTAIYYPLALHQQPCFSYLNAGPFPEAERAAKESLALPMWPEMSAEQRAHVIESVNAFA